MTYKVSTPVPFLSSEISVQAHTQTGARSIFIQVARRLYHQSLVVLYQNPPIIPMTVINDLMQAANLGVNIKFEQLVKVLSPANIPLPQKLKIYDKFSKINKDAAYQCALAYMGMGGFPQTVNHSAALRYLHRAIRLDHETAFSTFLSAICDRKLTVTSKQFLDTCKDLILVYGKVEVAHTLGALMCDYKIKKKPELNDLLQLKNPNEGYIYLMYVVEHGNENLKKIALENIAYGVERGLFTSPEALEFQKKYKIALLPAQPTVEISMKR